MPNRPRHVLARFPDQRQRVQALMDADPEFRAICADHADAVEALNRWRLSTDPRRAARIEEYESLAGELEAEIRERLTRGQRNGAGGRHP